MMKKMNKKAFTLIELLVVIAVIGILVLFGAPRFTGHTQKAELTRIQHDIKVMEQEVGTVLINGDDEFNEWENSDKDFNQLIQEGKLFEKEGPVTNGVEPIDEAYKVIPEKYKDKINTKLKGTFYANSNGKVYYEHLKPLSGIPTEPEKEPVYSDEEIGDLIENDFIPVATADELDSIRENKERTYGKGTQWEGKYTGGLGKRYVQVLNIDLSGYSEDGWSPIGTDEESSFTGTYDGGNYVIRGLEVKGEGKADQGLFGVIEGATIRNVELIDNTVTGDEYVGGLVGYANWSTIENSYATGSVTGVNQVGGLVGMADVKTKISNSYATGSVDGSGNYVGGLVGQAENSTIENSYATGEVAGTSTRRAGGLVGSAENSTKISNSYATGAVEGSLNVGGLVGSAGNSYIENSYATGSVKGSGSAGADEPIVMSMGNINNSDATGEVTYTGKHVGGLVGDAWRITIENSYAKGKVTGGERVGGLVGSAGNAGNAGNRSTISNSYATGSVEGRDWIGGLVGWADENIIEKSYATGAVEGTNGVGGLVGMAHYSNKISNSYATGSVKGSEMVGGLMGGVYNYTSISNSYSTGSVTGEYDVGGFVGYAERATISNSYAEGSVEGTYNVGGLVGYAHDSTITSSYWNINTTGRSSSAGQDESFGKTTEEMKKKATYEGWDFNTGWKIDEGKDYPKLR